MRQRWMVLACCLMATGVAGQAQKAFPAKRYAFLKKVVDRHVGHAHFTRGMSMDTILALGREAAEADIPVLAVMMNDPDDVTAMTAAEVLPTLGAEGIRAFKSAKTRLSKSDLDLYLGEAEDTKRRIEAHKRR